MRYHVYTDVRHPNGTLASGSLLSVYGDAAMTAPIALYADETTGTTLENPYTVPITGICNFWTDDVTPWVLAENDTTPKPIYVNISAGDGTFNVKDYGAVGDGVTDDALAIQAAIDAPISGGAVLIPPNVTCMVGTTLSPPAGVSLVGSGPSSVIRAKDGLNDSILLVAADNVTIRDLKFDGNAAHQSAGDYQKAVVRVRGAGRPSLIDVEITDAYTTALYMGCDAAGVVATTNATIRGCRIHDCGLEAMHFSDVDGLVFSGNHVYEWAKDFVAGQQETGDSCPGLRVWGGFGGNRRWAFNGNVLTGNDKAVFGIESGSSYFEEVLADSSCTGNVFDSQGGRAGGFSGLFFRCTFSGNTHINGSGGLWSGYELVGQDCVVSGNQLDEGIIVLGGGAGSQSQNLLISGNRVSSSVDNGGCIGFGVAAAAIKGVSVVGNQIFPTGTGASNGIDCGFCGTVGVVTDVLIANNVICGDDTGHGSGISLLAADGSAGITITGNVAHGRCQGVLLWPQPYEWADEVTITGNDLRGNGTPFSGITTATGIYRVYQNVLADAQVAATVTDLPTLLTALAAEGLIVDGS